MSFTGKTDNEPDATTVAFWSAAEAGELEEVEWLLPRVADVNARNEHGVTALMRAAQHGHARVVRLLLARGADANIIRNDKFTALSLAAFFGHTEVVRALMEHGADSKASTRNGTSPHMWATARTFNEVVTQLKNPAPPRHDEPPVSARPIPALRMKPARKVVEVPVVPPVVRTLKDPPEIWDLVHEVPKGFNARKAFVGHLRSMRMTVRIATAVGLIGACIVGVWVLRGVQARNEVTLLRSQTSPAAPAVELQRESKTVPEQPVAAAPATAPAAAPDFVPPVLPLATPDLGTVSARRRSSHSRMVRATESGESFETPPPAPTASVQKPAASSEKSDLKVRPIATPQAKSSSPLSPQLITPAKNDSPKTKVIQWP